MVVCALNDPRLDKQVAKFIIALHFARKAGSRACIDQICPIKSKNIAGSPTMHYAHK